MMGLQPRTEPLFYYFRLEDQIPEHHLLRRIDRCVDFSFVLERLRGAYSPMGRPSIDPEILLRLLLVGYLYGITSERRLVEEVRMHLAYRWFTHLGFEQEIPDHSTFSKNRHGRFRESGIFLEVFEEVVRRCLEAGLVEGKRTTVDGTAVRANASPQSRVLRQELGEVAKLSKTVREYLAEVEQENPATDPEARWAGKGGPAAPSYYDHYLIDNAHGIILGVEATPARFRQEMLAARRVLEQVKGRWGICPESLGADKAYGSGEFLAWQLERNIQPHIPVIDRRHQTPRYFTQDQFQYDPEENAYRCPQGQMVRYRGLGVLTQSYLYRTSESQCRACAMKRKCTRGANRRISVSWYEPARQAARELAKTAAYQQSRRERNKVEALLSELKQRVGLRQVRLRGLWNMAEQFYLAATAQNLKRLARWLTQREPAPTLCTA
jgi:transposase